MLRIPPWVSGLRPYEPGKPIEEVERELGVSGALKLASNENPWGVPPRAQAAAAGALATLNLYPDAGAFKLRQALSDRLGVPMTELVVGNGSNELISLLIKALVLPDEAVLTSRGSFVAYKLCTLAQGRRFVEAPPAVDLGYDLDALLAAVSPDTKLIFIANPDNPTGTYRDHTAIEAFLSALQDKTAASPAGPPVVALDEAYLDFVAPDVPHPVSGLALRTAYPRLALLRTFSKAYGLAALRVGYAIVPPDLADYLHRVREPFNVNTIAQVAAIAALSDEAWVQTTTAAVVAERPRLTAGLTALGLRVLPSQANFVLASLQALPGTLSDARVLNDRLMRRGIIARPMAAGGLPQHLRITIGRPEDNDRTLAALTAILADPA